MKQKDKSKKGEFWNVGKLKIGPKKERVKKPTSWDKYTADRKILDEKLGDD